MKKLAFVFVVLGSGLTAFGLSGCQLDVHPWIGPVEPGPGFYYTAGWTLFNQLEITIGVVLLVCGLLLRRDSK